MAKVQNTKAEVEVPSAIVARVQDQLKTLEAVEAKGVPGNMRAINVARQVYAAILAGGKLPEVQAIMSQNPVPASLSGGGAWLPRDIQFYIGRIQKDAEGNEDTILIVKTSGFTKSQPKGYEEAGSLELKGQTVDWTATVQGVFVTCLKCGSIHATKEPAHQFYCVSCQGSVLRSKTSVKPTVALTKMSGSDKKIFSLASNVFRMRTTKTGLYDAYVRTLNAERAALGKPEITEAEIDAAKSSVDLMN